MFYNPKSRRQFLVGSGKAFLALPVLESLLPRWASAQTSTPERRFIAVWLPLGGFNALDLYPTYAADVPTALYSNHTIYQTALRLSPALGAISKIYSAALNPYLAKLNLIEGLDCPIGFNHGENTFLGHYRYLRGGDSVRGGQMLAMYPDVASIDQFLAYSKKFYPQIPVRRSVNGTSGFLAAGRMGLLIPGDPNSGSTQLSPDRTPHKIFDDLFGPGTPALTSSGPSASQLQSKTLIDQVLGDLKAVRSGRLISGADKVKLDSFATEMQELQQKLIATSAVLPMCSKPTTPTDNLTIDDIGSNMDRTTFYDLYTSIIAAGIKCGRTKIATMTGGNNIESGSGNLHSWGHDGKTDDVANTMRWTLENVFVPLLRKLDVDEGGGKTYLDNSLMIFGNDNSKIHKSWSRPILTAGSAGGFLKTGNYVDYRQRGVLTKLAYYGTGNFPAHEMYPGILYNQLLVTALQAMGLTPADYDRPGILGYSGAALIDNDPTSGTSGINLATGVHAHTHCLADAGKLLPLLVKA